jgi:hypothetical protein
MSKCDFCEIPCRNIDWCEFTDEGIKLRTERIIIPNKWIKQCREFAEESSHTSVNHYKKRRQGNIDKIKEDIFIGKMGEVGVHLFLKSQGIEINKPDFEIYSGRKKSFDSDLQSDKYDIHCKSQGESSASRFGISWILQYGGAGYGHQDKLFKHQTKHDILAPSVVRGDEVELLALIPIKTIFEKDMVDMPKLNWLRNTKRALYWERLKDLSYYNRWGILKRLKNEG